MQIRIKCFYRSQHGFEIHGGYDIGMIEAILEPFNELHRMGSNKLGAVDQGQSFLGSQFKRMQGRDRASNADARNDSAMVKYLSISDQGQKQMSQRRQVTGCPDRTL